MANGLLFKIVVGAVVGTAVTLTGGSMVGNVREHTEIRKESIAGDEKVMIKVDKISDIVTDIRLEQREMSSYIKSKL